MGKYRMYSLVLKQLSPIQKGIQSSHSIIEYSARYHKNSEFINWNTVDKTIIIADGGTSRDLKKTWDFLLSLKIPFSAYRNNDMGGIVTSLSFILEDKVWDTEIYPADEDYFIDDSDSSEFPAWLIEMGGPRNLKIRNFILDKQIFE